MLQDFHFKILHYFGNKHANVDALSKNPIFILDEKQDFQVEISNHAISSSKTTTNALVKLMVGTSSGHGVPRIFTLFEALEEFSLETLDGVN
jgi:hypothetical protein